MCAQLPVLARAVAAAGAGLGVAVRAGAAAGAAAGAGAGAGEAAGRSAALVCELVELVANEDGGVKLAAAPTRPGSRRCCPFGGQSSKTLARGDLDTDNSLLALA